MVAVKEFTWEEVSAPDFGTTSRQAFRQALAGIAEKARTTLPDSNGRVDKAVALVLNGDVVLGPHHTATVYSQTKNTTYEVRVGYCSCKDFEQAPQGLCKHRLAAAMLRKATATLEPSAPAEPPPMPADSEPSPHPRLAPEHLVRIQGKTFVRYAGLLHLAQAQGLTSLTAAWTYNDAELSLATATATFADGRTFTEAGDASPSNVGRQVAPSWRRMALTRAKSRVLRDATGLDLVAVEELGEGA